MTENISPVGNLSAEYAAGFFDGEGCVMIAYGSRVNGKTYHKLNVTVSNTNEAVLLKFKDKYGGYVKSWMPKKGNLRMYEWLVSGRSATPFLDDIYDYAIIKRPQIDIAYRYIETVSEHNAGKHLKPVTPELWTLRESLRNELQVYNHKGKHLRKVKTLDDAMESKPAV